MPSYIMTFGKCTICGKKPAVLMPLRICEDCNRKMQRLPGAPGSLERRRNFEKFLGMPIDKYLKMIRGK